MSSLRRKSLRGKTAVATNLDESPLLAFNDTKPTTTNGT